MRGFSGLAVDYMSGVDEFLQELHSIQHYVDAEKLAHDRVVILQMSYIILNRLQNYLREKENLIRTVVELETRFVWATQTRN